jgi:hypothetical protein
MRVQSGLSQNTPPSPPKQGRNRHCHPAFRASPACWPGVDPLADDPLGDDSLFVEPTLYRVTIDGARFSVADAEALPAATIDLLQFILGGQDFGIVCPTNYGESDAFVVVRARDFEALLEFADYGPLTWATREGGRRR